jgi:hypothetical protein
LIGLLMELVGKKIANWSVAKNTILKPKSDT